MELGLSMNIVAIGNYGGYLADRSTLDRRRRGDDRGIAILDQAIVDVLAASTCRAAE